MRAICFRWAHSFVDDGVSDINKVELTDLADIPNGATDPAHDGALKVVSGLRR